MDYAEFYNKQPEYYAFRNNNIKQEEYKIAVDWKARKLSQLIPDDFKAKNILEVGCAFGVLLNNLSDRLHIPIRFGVDISSENIRLAKDLYPGCNFFQGTIEEFSRVIPPEIQNHRFDLVVLSDIVEHVPDDLAFLKFIRNMSSYVVLNLPLEKSFKTRNRQYGEHDPSGHLRCYDKELAVKLLALTGFEIITSFTSVAFHDKQFYNIYKKNRAIRIKSKSLALRLFWSLFYFGEDRIRLASEKLSEKISGTNYFALLKSIN